MSQNNCIPANVYGPFRHTLFLGLSVIDFSCQAGWNDQSSSLTVTLVDDPCEGNREYFDTNFNWTSSVLPSDPGFNQAPLGSAAIFKIGETRDEFGTITFDGFEYAGIVQSYNTQTNTNGKDIITVTLVSPLTLLKGTNFIVDQYVSPISVDGDPLYPQNVQNLINVYGYLENLGFGCFDFSETDDPFGAGLGAPGSSFGGAQKTNAGVPWNLIRKSIQILCGGNYFGDLRLAGNDQAQKTFLQSSPPGTLKYIGGVGTYGSIVSDQYILDISELPGEITSSDGLPNNPGGGGGTAATLDLSNNQYRVQGPIISAPDIISQVAEDGGLDYTVDLLPTKAIISAANNSKTGAAGNVVNVIKIRAVPRIDVPDSVTLGSIQNFVNVASGAGILSDFNIGQELVQEDNAAFIIGGQRQDLFQVYGTDTASVSRNRGILGTGPTSGSNISPFFGYQPEIANQCLTGVGATETRYREPVYVWWGLEPYAVPPSQPEGSNGCPDYQDWFRHQYFFGLDWNKLPLNFYYEPVVTEYAGEPESMLCAALGDFESFWQWLFNKMFEPNLPPAGLGKRKPVRVKGASLTPLTSAILDTFDILFPDTDLSQALQGPGSAALQNATQENYLGFEDMNMLYAGRRFSKTADPEANFIKRYQNLVYQDIQTIYNYLHDMANKYYGKAFNVEIPGLCFYVDPDSGEVVFSDSPAVDGAWVDTFYSFDCGDGDDIGFGDPSIYPNCVSGGQTGILGLQHPEQTDYFADDQGKLPAIIKFDPYLSYGVPQDTYEELLSQEGIDLSNPESVKKIGPPNFFNAGNIGDAGFRNSPFGFSSLGFTPFTPLYMRGQVKEVWNVFKKPQWRFDDEGCLGQVPEELTACSVCAVVEMPQRVTLTPSLGFRNKLKKGKDENGNDIILVEDEDYLPEFPYFGLGEENCTKLLGNNWRLGTWFKEWQFSQDPDVKPREVNDLEYFINRVANISSNILKSTAIGLGNLPFALPCNAVVPVKSNTRTYGPWFQQGYTDENSPILSNLIQGNIYTEKDDSAVPWEFGGSLFLYQGMSAKVRSLIMKMQNAERGTVTVAGYPQKQLGTSLYERPSYINNANEPGTQRGIPRSLDLNFYDSAEGQKSFYAINTYPSGQPLTQITDMSVNVSDGGIQTTYTLSAYTPFKDRFTKTNYDRIKNQGLERFKQRRDAIAKNRDRQEKFGTAQGFRIDTDGVMQRYPIITSITERSPAVGLAGRYLGKNENILPSANEIFDGNEEAGGVSRKEIGTVSISQMMQYDVSTWNDMGFISWDGLIRPVRKRANVNETNAHTTIKNGSGLGSELPIQNDTGNFHVNLDPFSISGWEGDGQNPYNRIAPVNSGVLKPPSYARVPDQQNSAEPMAPLNGGVSSSFFPRPEINAEFLNFLANPNSDLSNRGKRDKGEGPKGDFGHDIEVVARSSGEAIVNNNAGYVSLLSTGTPSGLGYTEDYRFMAMRGPIMVHGWGYDLQGKPIPNSNETGVFSGQWDITVNQSDFSSTTGWLDESYWTSGSPFSGQHRKDYNLLTDDFYSGWLQQPETWPAGPIDLRWDRQRSVWTVPNSYEFAFVDLETGIGGFASGDGFVRNYTDMYDADGTPIFTDVTVVNPFEDEIPAQSIIAFYSKRFGTWFPIQYCCGTTTPTPPPPPPPPPTGCFDCNGQGACFWECVNGQWVQQGECPASAGCNCIPPGNCNNCPNDFEGKVAAGLCIKPFCDDVRNDCDGDGQGGGNDSNPPGDDGGTPIPIVNYTVGNEASFSGIALSTYTTNEFNTYSTKPLRGRLQSNFTSYGPQSTGWGLVELYDGYETVFSGPYAAATGSGLVTSCIGFGYTDDPNCPPSGGRDNYKYALVMNNGICGHLPSGAEVNIQLDKQYGLFSIVDYNCKSSEEVTADGDILFYEHTKADATSADIVLTLPDATGAFIPGKSYYVKKVDATSNTVTVTGSSSQLIDGQSSYVMNNQYEAIKLVACGTGWMIF